MTETETSKPNLLELAKQGNPKAIAILLNRHLESKGITVKATLKYSTFYTFSCMLHHSCKT